MPTQQELKQQGNIHFQNDDFDKAIEFYTLAIEKEAFCDEAAPILSNRSLCYYNIKKYKEAYEDAGCCCGIRPDWAKGFARRGAAAEKLGEWEIALESYDEYLKLDKSDEMNITNKQKTAKKIADEIEKKKREKEKELRRIDQELTSMKDGSEEKQIKAYTLFHDGVKEMIIDKVELAVKHGVDLGRKWLREALTISAFTNVLFAAAERIYQSTNDWHLKIHAGASFALTHLMTTRSSTDDSQFVQTSLLVKQRDYLDRLLDVVYKQCTKYEAPFHLKSYVGVLLSAGNKFPFRTDFFLLLNTERGKNFFVGDTMTMKQWRVYLIKSILDMGNGLNRDPMKVKTDLGAMQRPTGIHLRRLLESLEIGLQGISAQDLNTKIPDDFADDMFNEREVYLLCLGVHYMPSPEILELLLRKGANPNIESCSTRAWSNQRSVMPLSVLDVAFQQCHYSCARVLLSYGAKITTEPTPSWILEHPFYASLASSSSSSSMLLPKTFYYPFLRDFIGLKAEDDAIDEEPIRTLADAMTEQNISFISVDENKYIYTPLTCAIDDKSPLKLIEVLLKVRPKLLNTPVPWSTDLVDRGRVIYPVLCLIDLLTESTLERQEHLHESFDYVKSVMKLFFDTSRLTYDEFIAEQMGDALLITFPQYIKRRIAEHEKFAKDPESLKRANRLKEFEDFCINYRKENKDCERDEKHNKTISTLN